MSRIGKKPVAIPSGVNVTVKKREITVKGPKGQLAWEHPDLVSVSVAEGAAQVERATDSKEARARHGLVRSLVQNMVTGVSEGFTRELEIQGVGFRAAVQGSKITFSIGFSHPVEFQLPKGVTAEVDKKQTSLKLAGIDKQELGQVCADIKALRPPDAYKGKGIRNAGERIKLKAGKTSKK
jgi:large subunit ribosomal protein L6